MEITKLLGGNLEEGAASARSGMVSADEVRRKLVEEGVSAERADAIVKSLTRPSLQDSAAALAESGGGPSRGMEKAVAAGQDPPAYDRQKGSGGAIHMNASAGDPNQNSWRQIQGVALGDYTDSRATELVWMSQASSNEKDAELDVMFLKRAFEADNCGIARQQVGSIILGMKSDIVRETLVRLDIIEGDGSGHPRLKAQALRELNQFAELARELNSILGKMKTKQRRLEDDDCMVIGMSGANKSPKTSPNASPGGLSPAATPREGNSAQTTAILLQPLVQALEKMVTHATGAKGGSAKSGLGAKTDRETLRKRMVEQGKAALTEKDLKIWEVDLAPHTGDPMMYAKCLGYIGDGSRQAYSGVTGQLLINLEKAHKDLMVTRKKIVERLLQEGQGQASSSILQIQQLFRDCTEAHVTLLRENQKSCMAYEEDKGTTELLGRMLEGFKKQTEQMEVIREERDKMFRGDTLFSPDVNELQGAILSMCGLDVSSMKTKQQVVALNAMTSARRAYDANAPAVYTSPATKTHINVGDRSSPAVAAAQTLRGVGATGRGIGITHPNAHAIVGSGTFGSVSKNQVTCATEQGGC